mmetsp:Transcript_570/g.1087  ORF Transcript_570/g.1087 Transcript_570/m.1087 type:complete len:228 (-) Transcript_570:233-916(-)|eukprot:CAMPEP_0183716024 /NCGR_PEP_ID=MMETSP0737-20130205/10048_1 /TAXON_ID=385413 /ORGANISM="Thalassiosira miniscula, Strain CCMP1093" /LENGTH=227 /DNA_ID=CAMNT_0025945229 /DNA_START=151 /DNA_END=834 /DNA_ORIENTATION=-
MSIAWSCVARDGIILAEAGADDGSGKVIRTAQKISRMKPTAGWEKAWSFKDAPYRGIKFHLHEVDAEDADKILIWTFCAVYDSKRTSEECVKAFLTKIVYVTEALREMPWWREGTVLSAQPSFAPTLQQQMESAEQNGKLSMLNQHVEETKAIMASNIENILERGERMEDLQAESKELSEMSKVFKKKAKQLKRFKMWQNAKHGVMVGTAVTGAVGVVVIPPLIALL